MSHALLTVEIGQEQDLVLVRQRARQLAALLGFRDQDQTRVATAASEIARNAFKYAGRGSAEFSFEPKPPSLVIRVRDRGPGIAELQAVLDGRYVSKSGMGLGLTGSRRLMDDFEVETRPGEGTVVTLIKVLPPGSAPVGPRELAHVSEELARRTIQTPMEVVEQQNRELLQGLAEVERREAELARLNSELQETNSGVVALSRELEDKAEALRRASDLKSSFLSNISHEFRTPLNSILSLSRLLLERVDGELTGEQERQVTFINKSAEALSELINDLLDLAKIEAGKTEAHPKVFEVEELFSTLRGMLRPLLTGDAVALVFEPPQALPKLFTDEGKLAQILRNFISNALKFTERGEVRVRARRDPGGRVSFEVADTGIGIAPEHHERVFEEFSQVEGPLQRKVKGTGLGLPLSRKLARLLGGDVTVQSAPGRGSTFTLTVPALCPLDGDPPPELRWAWASDAACAGPVLLVEDDPDTLGLYRQHLVESGFDVVPARSLHEAREAVARARPAAVVLDVLLGTELGWDFLSELKRAPATRDIPVLVVTNTDGENQAVALGAEGFCPKPVDRQWLVDTLRRLCAGAGPARKILIIDDDEAARYLLRRALEETPYTVVEACDGREGLKRAREELPQVIFLDMTMPELSGPEVLAALKADPVTAGIPVILHTSRPMPPEEVGRLPAVGLLPKEPASRERAAARVREALVKAGLSPRGEALRG